MIAHSYEVRVAPSARRNLNRIPPRRADAVLLFICSELTRHPRRVGKWLRLELEGRLGARVGDYRIVYLVDDENLIVTITRIEHRADVYRPR